MVSIILLIIFLIVIYILFSPYLDIYKDDDKKLHIILWFTNISGDRSFLKIYGSP